MGSAAYMPVESTGFKDGDTIGTVRTERVVCVSIAQQPRTIDSYRGAEAVCPWFEATFCRLRNDLQDAAAIYVEPVGDGFKMSIHGDAAAFSVGRVYRIRFEPDGA